jgi:hypothetical protein
MKPNPRDATPEQFARLYVKGLCYEAIAKRLGFCAPGALAHLKQKAQDLGLITPRHADPMICECGRRKRWRRDEGCKRCRELEKASAARAQKIAGKSGGEGTLCY